MPKLKEPSDRAKKYIKNRISGMNKKDAALKAGYALDTAESPGANIENQEAVKIALAEALDKVGMTNQKIAKIIMDAGDANKIYGTNDNFVEIEDHLIRLRSAELAAKIKGELIEKRETKLTGKSVIVLPETELNDRRNKGMVTPSRSSDGSIEEE